MLRRTNTGKRPFKRLFLRLMLITWAISGLLIGGVVSGSRGAEYRCLNALSDRMYIFDVTTGYYAPDPRKVVPGPQIARGTASPDGRYRAYFTAANHIVDLHIEPAWPGDRNPALCGNLQDCWRSRQDNRPGTVRFGVGANQSAWIAWSPRSDELAFGWIDPNGWLRVAIAAPDGTIKREKRIDQSLVSNSSLGEVIPYNWVVGSDNLAFKTIGRQNNRLYFWSLSSDQVVTYDFGPNSSISVAALAPRGERLAYIELRGGFPYLVIATPHERTEVAYALSAFHDWSLKWSPDGRHVALQWFEATYWRRDIFPVEPGRGVIRDVGGPVPGDVPAPLRGIPEIAWSADGRSLAFLRERGSGQYALTAFRLETGHYDDIVSDVAGGLVIGPGGKIAVTTKQPNGKLRLIVVDPDGSNRAELAGDVQRVNLVRWLDDHLLLYHARREKISVVLADVAHGQQRMLADDLEYVEDITATEGISGALTFNWIRKGERTGINVYNYAGELLATYRGEERAASLRTSPDQKFAAIYTQIVERYWGLQLASADGRWSSGLLLDSLDSIAELSPIRWSPDSRYIAYIRHDTRRLYGTNPQIEVVNTQGERVRVFNQVSEYYDALDWTRCD